MDWNKAKTLTIVFLLLLNAFLGFLIYLERDTYNLDARRVETIIYLLEKNNIVMDPSVTVPRSYRPLPQLSMNAFFYDEQELLEMFFTDLSRVREAVREFDRDTNIVTRRVFETIDQQQRLTEQNGFISFDCSSGTNQIEITRETVLEEAHRFLANMGEVSSFQLDSVFIDAEGARVRFCQIYNGNIIFTNFVEFWITEKGITRIDCTFSRPIGFINPPINLVAADEVLLHFMQFYMDAFDDRPAEILRIDLVYYQNEGSLIDSVKAEPHYRIVVRGLERHFLFNAYLNLVEQF